MTDPWYKKAFGPLYVDLYSHRDSAEAERGLDLLADLTELRGAEVLDLACGAGRHLAPLRARGARAVGVDLSGALIRRAARRAPVAQGDMRALPFLDNSFHGVLNMFTSFGYFPDREENLSILAEVERLLRQGGWFFFDYLHSEEVLGSLVESGERRVGRHVVREQRSYDDASRILTKRVEIVGDGERGAWDEKLYLFTPREIEAGLARAGFDTRRRFGDYDGAPFDRHSKRLIVYAVRESSGTAD